jgi:hypothetical protein
MRKPSGGPRSWEVHDCGKHREDPHAHDAAKTEAASDEALLTRGDKELELLDAEFEEICRKKEEAGLPPTVDSPKKRVRHILRSDRIDDDAEAVAPDEASSAKRLRQLMTRQEVHEWRMRMG